MKKTLLLSALLLCGASSFAQNAAKYVYAGEVATGDAVTSLQDGQLYVMYDNFNGTGGGDRRAFRFANESNNQVGGEHVTTTTRSQGFDPNYVWEAVADGDNWKFKNIANNLYIPAATGNTSPVTMSSTAGKFTLTPMNESTTTQFYVANVDATNIRWDGNGADTYTMAQWNNSGHTYSFYEVEEYKPLFTDGGFYRLKSIKDTRNRYLNMNVESNSSLGNETTYNAFVDEVGSVVYVTAKPSSALNEWRIQEQNDAGNTLSASSWNCRTSESPFYWIASLASGDFDTENPVVTLYQGTTGNKGFLGYGKDKGDKEFRLYANYSVSELNANYGMWELIPVSSKTLTLTFKRSEDDTNPFVETREVVYSTTEFPEYEGFTLKTTGTIAENNSAATYIMNKGEEFRIFNKRAYEALGQFVFVNIANNGLRQVASSDDPTSVFYKVPMGNDGGFAIWSEVEQKFVGNLAGSGSAVPMVEFTNTPVKYYTGKQAAPDDYMDWIGDVPSSSTAGYHFFNDNANSGANNRFVCAYSNDAGSKWVIVTNMDNFITNWELSEELRASSSAYTDALQILNREDEDGLAAWASNYNFNGNVNLPVSDENQQKIHKINEVVEEALVYYPDYIMTQTKLYTIKSSDNRGYLIHDSETGLISTASTVDTENNDHLWGFVKVGEHYYLYNRGAEKFASAYIPREGTSGTATYAWSVSEIPTAIRLTNRAFGAQAALAENLFTIEGGKSYNTNPAGMMIINNNTTKVPCSLGEGSITDGTGFILTEVRDTDKDAEMMEAVAAGFAKVNAEIDAISVLEWEADVEGILVGHHTPEAVEAFMNSIYAAKENADKEAALYSALNAQNTFENAEKRQVVNGHVYSITDSEGNVHYTDGVEHLVGEFTIDETAYSYWVATVDEDGNISFSHSHEGEEEAAPVTLYYDTAAVPFTINDVTAFHVQPTTELGKVSLVNAADNTPVDDKSYNISFVSANSNDGTTKIAEINAENAAAGAVYDLQGRKLAAPIKGINIINGKKIIVK